MTQIMAGLRWPLYGSIGTPDRPANATCFRADRPPTMAAVPMPQRPATALRCCSTCSD